MIARTGFFVLCSVFKEHDPRELSQKTGQNSVHPEVRQPAKAISPETTWLPEQLPIVEAASGAESHSSEWVRPTQLDSARSSHMPKSGGSTSPLRQCRSEVVRAP